MIGLDDNIPPIDIRKDDCDNIIAVVLILFSLLNIYVYLTFKKWIFKKVHQILITQRLSNHGGFTCLL